jgi:hypothetical protein
MMTSTSQRPSSALLRSAVALVAVAGVCISVEAPCKTLEAAVAQEPELPDATLTEVRSAVGSDTPRLRRLFSQLHADTQVGHVEALRAGVIANELLALGLDVEFGADGTEVIAALRHGAGPTLLYRVDTGADLGVTEHGIPMVSSAHPPAPSQPPPSAEPAAATEHRCGDDAQVVWLLGMVRALVALRSEWSGTLLVVAQPTRHLMEGGPTLEVSADGSSRHLPRADLVIALTAGTAPVGSVLALRGRRAVQNERLGVTASRYGVYGSPAYVDDVSELASWTLQLYGLPEAAAFGYVVVGVTPQSLAASMPDEFDSASFFERTRPAEVDFAAIPLGAKLAATAVLDLLKKPASGVRKGASWAPHPY